MQVAGRLTLNIWVCKVKIDYIAVNKACPIGRIAIHGNRAIIGIIDYRIAYSLNSRFNPQIIQIIIVAVPRIIHHP
ncbi:hypothetical protein ES703_114812 [subsurface metagenome]